MPVSDVRAGRVMTVDYMNTVRYDQIWRHGPLVLLGGSNPLSQLD